MHPNADNLIASRFDTVIYDLDGTLIDSARDMQVAVSRVLADHGLPPVSRGRRAHLHGRGQQGHHGQGLRQVRQHARRRRG